jgi:hypothetical protein
MIRSNSVRAWLRRAVAAAVFSTALLGVSADALATWRSPSWWPFTPRPRPTPEIDAGLVRSAAAVLIGGLLVLRGRRRSS